MDTAQDGCAADCQHRIDCGSTTPLAECTAECVASVTGVIREDVFNDVVDCSTQLACGASNDACEALCTPTAAHERYEAACRGVFAACLDPTELNNLCSVTPTGSGDAGSFCYFAPSIIDEFTACVPAGSVTTRSKNDGGTSAPLGMKGIFWLITPTVSSGWPAARSFSTTSSTTSGLLDSDSRSEAPSPREATAWAITFMPCTAMSRATKV